jgi:hypothetical protein
MAWAWDGHGMGSVNQTRPHCVNLMGKTHSKPLAERHGRGRHGHGESVLRGQFVPTAGQNATKKRKISKASKIDRARAELVCS